MIVISGALVLVALVLLVLGLTMTDLNFVYGSIAVSLISFVFLVIGILQRRGEQPAEAGAGAPEVSDDTSAVAVEPSSPAKTGGAGSVPVTADDADGYEEVEEDEEPFVGTGGPTVLVVPGRPRYHVDGCRYLTGKEVEELDVVDARAQYSPCGVCKPDAVVDAQLDPVEDDVADEPVVEEVVEEPVAPRARRASSTRTPRSTSGPARSGRRTPARTTSAAAATTAVSTVDPPDPAVATEPEATEALEAPAAAAAPAAAPAKSAPRRKVVVIPDRGRFHTADCRFVRDALGTEELSRTAATKQGYKACGVCKP